MLNAILTDAKEIRYCRLNHDYDAYLNDQYIGSFPSYLAAETELDRLASDLIAQTAWETSDAEADRAAELSEEPSLPIERTYACMVETCVQTPRHFLRDAPLCCAHYAEACGFECDCYDNDDYGDAMAESAQGTYNGFVPDPPVDSPAPPPWTECKACGGAHHIQQCGAIRARLFAPAIDATALLAEADAVLIESDLDARNRRYCLAHGLVTVEQLAQVAA